MSPKQIAIVGGGLAGVAAAYFQRKKWGKDVKIFLIEKTSRLGGWVHSLLYKDFFFEQGPRSFRGGSKNRQLLTLIEELGLEQEWIGSHPSCLTRYLYLGDKLEALPKNFFSFLFSPLRKGWLQAFCSAWKTQTVPFDESVLDFFSRHLGRAWTERFIDPLVSGIYAGSSAQLSMQSSFPHLQRAVKETGSLFKGLVTLRKEQEILPTSPWVAYAEQFPSFSFRGGVIQLVESLFAKAESEVFFNSTADRPIWKGNKILLPLSTERCLEVDRLILALPFPAIAALLPPLAPLLNTTPFASVVIVNCGFLQKVLQKLGFGYLTPLDKESPILGATFDSCLFPEHNRGIQERIAVMIGGAHHPAAIDLSDTALFALTKHALVRHMGIGISPQVMQICRLRNAIPQYGIGHKARYQALNTLVYGLYPNLFITGSSVAGVSMPEVLAHAQQL